MQLEDIQVLPVEAEDFDAIADLIMEAMAPDLICQNIYPPHLAAPGPRGNTERYARMSRKRFEKDNGKLHYLKAVQAGSSTPIGFARWQDPAQWATECAEADKEETKDDRKDEDSSIVDSEFLDRFVKEMTDARKRRFPDGKPHWYCELLAVSPKYHRGGIGNRLLHFGIDQSIAAAARGVDEPCYLESSKAGKRLYMREGFEEVETLHVKAWTGGDCQAGEEIDYSWPAMVRRAMNP